MIWLSPLAWGGLVVLAVPLLIHLLGRRSARVQRFPTLRFIDRSPLIAVRRTRLSDLPLLLVRLGILAAAVAALANPLLLTDERERDLGRALARAIVVDTGASMRRATLGGPSGERAIDRARSDAERLGAGARTSVRIETNAPGRLVAGGAAWLATQSGRRELVVLSDFQLGALDSASLAAIPPEVGVRLEQIAIQPLAPPIDVPVEGSETGVIARVTPTADRTVVQWVAGARRPGEPSDALLLLGGTTERARAAAARAAAEAIAPVIVSAERPVAIIYRGFENRTALVRAAAPLTHPWQGDAVERLAHDGALRAAATADESARDPSIAAAPGAPFTVIARTTAGDPAIVAASGRVEGATNPRDHLLLFLLADAGSLTSAALIRAVSGATVTRPDIAELEPETISDVVLDRWRRDAAPAVMTDARGATSQSDGRWFWGLALMLLAAETWMRRARREPASAEADHARAA